MATVKRTVLTHDGGVKLIYTATDGTYLGSAVIEVVDQQAMKIIANDMPELMDEMDRPNLQVVS